MVLANLCSVEHGVEGGDLVDLHGGHLEDLGSLVHGGKREEVIVLLLSDEQDWDDGRGLVVVGVLGKELLNGCVAFSSELKRCLLLVVFSVTMVCKRTEAESLRSSHQHGQGSACHRSDAVAKREETSGEHLRQRFCCNE